MLTWIFYAAVIASTFCIVVALHEWGHYLAMRRYNVKVATFSVGMGPELWGITDKLGTRWRLSWLPIGGYVAPADENYENKVTPWQSIVIYAAGPAFSIAPPFLIAWIYFIVENGFFSGSWMVVAETLKFYFFQFTALANMLMGSTEEVGGPVAIGKTTVEFTRDGAWMGYIAFIFIFSGAIGMFNLLPIRPLDGGGIVAAIFRMILSEKSYKQFNAVYSGLGVILILGLVVYITWHDIARLF